MPKKTKRRITKFRMNELSAVDRPAQEGARSLILKRFGQTVMMTLPDDTGHAHLLDTDAAANEMSHATNVDNSENFHTHPYTIDEQGNIEIGESDGHTHQVDEEKLAAMLMTAAIREQIERDLVEASENEIFRRFNKSFTAGIAQLIQEGVAMQDGTFPIVTASDLNTALVALEKVQDKTAAAEHIKKRAEVLGLTDKLLNNGKLESIFFKDAAGNGGEHSTEVDMPENKAATEDKVDFEKKAAELEKSVADVTKQLAEAKAFGEFTDAEKAHYKQLTKAKQAKFLEKSREERLEELKQAADSDPVIYKSLSGHEFRKSDDSRLVEMAKQADADRKELQKQREANESLVLTKRAETELEFMPGTVETRVALLKAVDTIEDEEAKAEVLKSLKAKNAQMAGAFETVGSSVEKSYTVEDANAEMEKKAIELSAKENIDYYEAYDRVKKAEPALYKRALNG